MPTTADIERGRHPVERQLRQEFLTMPPFEAQAPDSPQTPPEGAITRPPRRIAVEAAYKILLAWFKGADWPQDRPCFFPIREVGVTYEAVGDELHVRGVLVARRAPSPWVAPQSPARGGAAVSYARAHCRAVVGGYAIAGEGPLLSGEALSKLYRCG